MEAQSYWETATILAGGVATLAIFSFIFKENPLFRFFEHLFIGISAGFGAIYTVKNFLWPKVFVPLFGLDIVRYPDGTYSAPYQPLVLLHLLPMLFGLLYYFIYSRKHNWLAKLVIGFSLGASGALYFQGFFNQTIPQVVSSFRPLVVFAEDGAVNWWASAENTFFVFTLCAVMYYFFFSFKHSNRVGNTVSSAGRWLLMVCFGAYFGSTVMARLALLVERLQFLIQVWWQSVVGLFA